VNVVTQLDPRVSWPERSKPGPVHGVIAAEAHGAQLSAALYRLDPATNVPDHSHDNEEFGQVISGSLELRCAGETLALRPGDAFIVPGGVEHGARAGSDGCELLECYAPPRAPAAPRHTGDSA
jgi:quercetin dioxygenase-like cupin family protein